MPASNNRAIAGNFLFLNRFYRNLHYAAYPGSKYICLRVADDAPGLHLT